MTASTAQSKKSDHHKQSIRGDLSMFEKIFKKSDKCKICYKPLSPENINIGFCKECVPKEITKLKKRIKISTIIGVILIIIVFVAIYYAKSTAFVSNVNGYKGDIFIPIFFGYVALNERAFNTITNLSLSMHILLATVCFLVPFASYINLGINTYRHEAETNLYDLEPITGSVLAGYGNHKVDEIGFFVISIILSIVSGPFFFIYKLYKLRQLSNYIKIITI